MKNRVSPRLQGYDYSQNGAYFVTICTKDRQPFFGEIVDGKMNLSEIGEICNKEILNTNNMRNNVSIDQYIIMPDHIHLIVIINRDVGTDCICPNKNTPKKDACNASLREDTNNFGPQKNNLSSIIRGLKGRITSKINKTSDQYFQRQGCYRNRIIRNEDEYTRISQYIIDNPLKWELDKNENGIFM